MNAPATAEELAHLGTSTVYEAGGRVGLIDLPLRRLGARLAAAGPVRTVACAPGDNLTLHIALKYARPGDVLVVATPDQEPVALVGELIATQAIAQGCAGLLVGAAVRDVDRLAQLDLVVLARHVRARGATRSTYGAIDVPLRIGGVVVFPGDMAVLDSDGAVVVPAADVEPTLSRARTRFEREEGLRSRFAAGLLSYEEYGLARLDPGAEESPEASGAGSGEGGS